MTPVLHIYKSGAVPGAVALCGYVKKDTRRYTQGPTCPQCAERV